MAERIESFQVTVPAGTLSTAPATTPLTFNVGEVERIEITVPPGPSGLMGFMLFYGEEAVIPYRGSTFIVTDNEHISWPISGYPTSGRWQLFAYNEDQYPHLIFVRFLVEETRRQQPSDVEPLLIRQPGMPQVVTE